MAELQIGNRTLLVAFVCMAFWFGASYDGLPARVGGSALAHAAGDENQSTASLEFPVLPACPGGLSVPCPPMDTKQSKAPTAAPQTEANNLVEGTGRYSGMVLIPAGPFEMGSAESEGRLDERPSHNVFLKDFYVAKQEVTVKEYCDFLNARGEKSRNGFSRVKLDSPYCPVEKDGRYFQPKPDVADKPVVCVTWYGAAEYAEWMGGRLPTSAEWEKAAVMSTPFQPGDYLTVLPREESVPVSIAAPGTRGITGMVGNVWEWCWDWYADDYYGKSVVDNPTGPPLGKEKVIRGGSWASPEASKRIRNVHMADPNGYFRTVGFRIVKD